eukprot:10284500-Ditylum_brightwellii.AAC.1
MPAEVTTTSGYNLVGTLWLTYQRNDCHWYTNHDNLSQAQVFSDSAHPFLEEIHGFLICNKNKFLMDVFCNMSPGNATLYHLALVRLYLGVTTLADITNDSGLNIQP